MNNKFWLMGWLGFSLSIFVAANLYTNSSIFDLTIGHVIIAGTLGFAAIAICFVIFESIMFIANLAKAAATKTSKH